MDEQRAAHHRERARQERARAEAATSMPARRAHLGLAERHDELAWEAAGGFTILPALDDMRGWPVPAHR